MNEKEMQRQLIVYSIALPGDISATRHQRVVDGVLRTDFVGTVYGCMVGTSSYGRYFDTFNKAHVNAGLFVKECEQIVKNHNLTFGEVIGNT